MNYQVLPYDLRRQLLKLLTEDAPLSAGCMRRLINPSIQRRRLLDSLKRLFDQGYLTKRSIFDSHWFYQIKQSVRGRRLASNILEVDPLSLLQPQFTHIDPILSDSIGTWKYYWVENPDMVAMANTFTMVILGNSTPTERLIFNAVSSKMSERLVLKR